MPLPLLILWDIDGTLLQRANRQHATAILEAVSEVHGVDVRGRTVAAAGRTDGAIARSLLETTGLTGEAVDRETARVRQLACERFAQLVPDSLTETVAPGIGELLEDLTGRSDRYRMSLLTGNFEPIARLKLDRAGLGRFFPAGQGAFGSDAEARNDLPPVARARAGAAASADERQRLDPDGSWPRSHTVIIGDTPLDIECARADGLGVLAVATGPHPAEDLDDADFVAEQAEDLRSVLRMLAHAELGFRGRPG